MLASELLFDGVTYSNDWERRQAWLDAVANAVVNVCQFVC